MREQKSLQVPAKTVTVLLSSEVVWQRVPDRRTHNSNGGMLWYHYQTIIINSRKRGGRWDLPPTMDK